MTFTIGFTVIKVQNSKSVRDYDERKPLQPCPANGQLSCKSCRSTVLVCHALSAPTYLAVCEGGCCVQGGVDERPRQVWDGVQRHVSVDVGVQMQSGVRRLLWTHELMAWRKGSSRHR